MKSQSAARSYAKALHDLARERGQAEAVGTELAQAVDVVRTDPALAHFFARPGVAAIAKRRTADEIAQRLGVGKLVRDFLGLVAAHGRGDILPEIGEAYRARVDAVVDKNLLGGFVAEIGSVIVDGSLDGQLARLKERLARG